VVAGAGSVKSSAGTYTAWKEVMEPFLVEVMPFLQVAHFGGEVGLVADGAGGAAQQGGHLGTGLGKAEDVVNKEQHVLVLLVAEVFSHGQAGKGHAQTRPGRLVHLAINKGDFGFVQVFWLMTPASDISW